MWCSLDIKVHIFTKVEQKDCTEGRSFGVVYVHRQNLSFLFFQNIGFSNFREPLEIMMLLRLVHNVAMGRFLLITCHAYTLDLQEVSVYDTVYIPCPHSCMDNVSAFM
ncbi:myb family transcription factor PHL7-like [Iris pallida]|uniref:Myb family transcription factor PHL7-like n=1 Tax=Iris pallida TaxID=29817 RepID=A0AAX6E8T2_IRIPA|nr:myb family transcription factor PHL7-like [Iris pallida]